MNIKLGMENGFKILTWNCNGAFRKKFESILDFDAESEYCYSFYMQWTTTKVRKHKLNTAFKHQYCNILFKKSQNFFLLLG